MTITAAGPSIAAEPHRTGPHVIELRGGTPASRAAQLASYAEDAITQGGTVRRINPAAKDGSARTLAGGHRTVFEMIDLLSDSAPAGHLLTIDNLGALLLDGEPARRDAFDLTLSLLISQCENSAVTVAIATRPGLARIAPATAFELRSATKIDL